MSEHKIPFFHSGIYKRKVNKVILPPNPQKAQQMEQIEAKAEREHLNSPPGLQFSLVVEGWVLEQVHGEGTISSAGPWAGSKGSPSDSTPLGGLNHPCHPRSTSL